MAGKMYAQLSLPLVMVMLVLVSICHCAPDPEARKKRHEESHNQAYSPIYGQIFSDDPEDPESGRRLIDTFISQINAVKEEYDIGPQPELDKMMDIFKELANLSDTNDMDCATLYDRILTHRKDKRVLQLYLDDCAQKQAERCPDEYEEFKQKQLE